MAPLVWALKKDGPKYGIATTVVSTKQHRDMVASFLGLFEVDIDSEMDLPDTKDRTLAQLTANVMTQSEGIFEQFNPDVVLVQGDTTSAMAMAMSAFYKGVPVGHVEAGLRTYNLRQPSPEEMNRQVISRIASMHFAPTKLSACALLAEGADPDHVLLTGNSVIDTFKWTLSSVLGAGVKAKGAGVPPGEGSVLGEHITEAFGADPALLALLTETPGAGLDGSDVSMPRFTHKDGRQVVLLTVHRRENHGKPLLRIFSAIKTLAAELPRIHFVYPVHPNQAVGDVAAKELGGIENVHLLPALGYDALVYLMSKSVLVLTDSGGLQEEATYLARPVLVMREATERLEGVLAGAATLVGTQTADILSSVRDVLSNRNGRYDAMAHRSLPYGDAKASERTLHALASLKGAILDRTLREGSVSAPGTGTPAAVGAAIRCPAALAAVAEFGAPQGQKGSLRSQP